MMRHNHHPPGNPGAATFNIDALVQDLAPVRRLQVRRGLVLALALTALCALGIGLSLGLRNDLAQGAPHWMFGVRAMTLLAVGVAAAVAALAQASPAVGTKRSRGWTWPLAAALIFPALALWALVTRLPDWDHIVQVLDPPYGLECLGMTALCATGVGAGLTLWIRRGAPVAPERAGWLVGLAAGALGAAAFSIHCSENVVMYIGTWYTLAVAGCALAGRLVVPPLLRW